MFLRFACSYLFLAVAPLFSQQPPAPSGNSAEQLLILVKGSLLKDLVMIPIFETNSINDSLKKAVTTGTATTVGDVTARLYPSSEGVGIALMCMTTTNADTKTSQTEKHVHATAGVTVQTITGSEKKFLLREKGFAELPTQTWVQSAASHGSTLSPPAVTSAQGLFKHSTTIAQVNPLTGEIHKQTYVQRTRLRDALRDPEMAPAPVIRTNIGAVKTIETVVQQKPSIEGKASQKIADEQTESFNTRAYDAILKANFAYYKNVYKTLIENKLLGGRLNMASSSDWLAIQGVRANELSEISPESIPGFQDIVGADPKNTIFIRVDVDLLERLGERLGGLSITEVELASLLQKIESEPTSLKEILGDEENEIMMHFSDARPITIKMNQNIIELTFNLQSVKVLDRNFSNVKIARNFVLNFAPSDGLTIEQQLPHRIVDENDATLPEKYARHITTRFKLVKPATPKKIISFFHLDKAKKDLRIGGLKADRDKLTLALGLE